MISKNIYRATRKLIEPCCEYKYSEPNIAPYIKSDRIDRWMEWSGISRAEEGVIVATSPSGQLGLHLKV